MNLTLHSMGLPEIDRIGRYPLVNPVFEFSYSNPAHTVHLYHYSARIRIDGEEYNIEPGDLSFIHKGTNYSLESEQPGDHWGIHFHENENEEGARIKFLPILRPGANSLFLREQIKHMSALHNARGRDYEVELMRAEAQYRLKAFLLSVYLQSWAHKPGARPGQSFDMDGLLAWMDEHLAEPLSVERVGRKAGASRATLARHFRQKLGMTLSQYLLGKRVDRAKSLLMTTRMPISEVGAAVGIPDPQYFNKQFRRVDGQSPSHFRESHKTLLTKMLPDKALQDGKWESREVDL